MIQKIYYRKDIEEQRKQLPVSLLTKTSNVKSDKN